jgi:hypothetical protein
MSTDRTRRAWLLCVVFGVAVATFLAWFAAVIPTQTCTGRQPRGTSAFLAYQLARTTADVEAVFGPEGDPCRAAMVAALNVANTVDLVAFIAVYSGFFASFFLALKRSGSVGIARIGFVAVVFTLVCDVLETSMQLYITSSLPGTVTSLVFLTIGDTGKFLGLGLVGVCAGAAMLARGGLLGRLTGAACLVGALMVVVGLNYFPAQPGIPAGGTLVWLATLLYAVMAAVRGAPAAAQAFS